MWTQRDLVHVVHQAPMGHDDGFGEQVVAVAEVIVDERRRDVEFEADLSQYDP